MISKLPNAKNILFLLVLTLSSFTFAQVKTDLQYLGNNDSYPYEFIDEEGKPEGFNIDVIKAIGKIMDFNADFQLKPWKQVNDYIIYGNKFDIAAMFYSEQREEAVDFSNPLIFSEDNIYIRKGSNNINSIIDLMGKKVAVEDGSFTEEYLIHNLPEVNLVLTQSEPDALTMLSQNKCDAAIVEKIVGDRNIIRLDLKNIKAAAYPVIPRQYGFVVFKGNDSLLSKINLGLTVIKNNGTYAALFNKWINPPAPQSVSMRTIITWAITILIIILLITGIIFLWIKSLKRLVNKRTLELQKEVEEHIKTEQQLKIQKEKAEESDKLKSEFLAQMSHEIRTPLNIILSHISLLELELKDDLQQKVDDKEIFSSLKEASHRLMRTVTSILDMSALRISKYEADFEIININEVLVNLYKSFYSLARNKKLEIELQQKLPDIKIKADYYTTVKLFENLIDNAVKFTDKGSITIIINKTQNEKINVEIKDTGIGIAEDYLPKIFDSFSQESSGYSRRYDGNGLGLSLAKEYAFINNFELNIKSEKGMGTIVSVLLQPENSI